MDSISLDNYDRTNNLITYFYKFEFFLQHLEKNKHRMHDKRFLNIARNLENNMLKIGNELLEIFRNIFSYWLKLHNLEEINQFSQARA